MQSVTYKNLSTTILNLSEGILQEKSKNGPTDNRAMQQSIGEGWRGKLQLLFQVQIYMASYLIYIRLGVVPRQKAAADMQGCEPPARIRSICLPSNERNLLQEK